MKLYLLNKNDAIGVVGSKIEDLTVSYKCAHLQISKTIPLLAINPKLVSNTELETYTSSSTTGSDNHYLIPDLDVVVFTLDNDNKLVDSDITILTNIYSKITGSYSTLVYSNTHKALLLLPYLDYIETEVVEIYKIGGKNSSSNLTFFLNDTINNNSTNIIPSLVGNLIDLEYKLLAVKGIEKGSTTLTNYIREYTGINKNLPFYTRKSVINLLKLGKVSSIFNNGMLDIGRITQTTPNTFRLKYDTVFTKKSDDEVYILLDF